jgi:hypothetical protein
MILITNRGEYRSSYMAKAVMAFVVVDMGGSKDNEGRMPTAPGP